MYEFSIETSCVLHCQFYRSNFDVVAHIYVLRKVVMHCPEFCFFKYGNPTQASLESVLFVD